MLRRCLVLALTATVLATSLASVAQGAKRRQENPRLHAFRSCTNLLTYAKRNGTRLIREAPLSPAGAPPQAPTDQQLGSGGGGSGEDRAAAPAPAPAVGGPEGQPTNVQEAGVDEPDVVKTSGSTVLVVARGRLYAVDGSADPPALLGSVDVPGYASELLVHGGRALVISSIGGGGPVVASQVGIAPPSRWLGRTRLSEVDITDPRAMKVVSTYDIEGSYTSARLTGATARVVLTTGARGIEMPDVSGSTSAAQVRRTWRRSLRRTRTRAWLPSAILRDGRTGKAKRRTAVRCRQVRRTQQFSGFGTITVLTIDMDRGLPAVDADALMTDGQTVYASQDRLYVASERWLGYDPSRREVLDEASTGLHAFSTEREGETNYVGSGEVPGYLLNQWSLSEHEGVLRAATTSMPPWDGGARSSSAVRTLAERGGRLEEIGRVGGLGEGERIYAVRFMGDTGYVVTFRQTDPLFVLDLASPAAPRKVGELKVPGYSAYLHPVGDGLLLGVGQNADSEGVRLGAHLSLFDVSNPQRPTRIDDESLGGDSYTDVEDDHHAFTWWAPGSLAVLPVSEFAGETTTLVARAFRVDRAGGIQPVARIAAQGDDRYRRSLVLGDRLLLVGFAGISSSPVASPRAGAYTSFPR
jgi:uncharacterized secreted protein with C-terminal beta-propeller domain